MKKILFLHPDLRGGGAEKVLINMINKLDSAKYNITLYTIFEEGVNKKLLTPNVEHKFIFRKVFRAWSIIQKIFTPSFLFKHIVGQNYDLVVAYLEGVPTRIVGGCNNNSTRIISWIHVDLGGFSIENTFRSKNEMKNIYLKYDAIVGVSNTALESLKFKIPSLPSKKLHVLHNVLDTDLIMTKGNELVKDINFSSNTINLCSVGRLTHQKGYIRLLKILAKLAAEKYNFHLYLVGDGEDRDQLIKIIQTQNLQNHITLLGFKDNPHKYVKNCDLFICSSYQEGFSTAVTECVLLGTPVITTNCAGMEEILVNGKYGKIVNNTDEDLYIGLKEFLKNKEYLSKYKNLTMQRSKELQNKNNISEIEKLFDKILN
ncbi:glycosyltransferase [Algibacter sp. Ld11]|uniref:glycosyltransferase n=1 Tax=Algibacter sp. Ld11 TaxID=649150 RepID=UPI003870A81E